MEENMINARILEAMNKQINAELHSAYLYLAMAAHLDDLNLSGMANWMQVQAREEVSHAMKFYRHIVDRGGNVKLTSIEGPPGTWESALHVFEEAYTHECKISALIHGLLDLAQAEKNHAAVPLLQWFVSEQVEEEANASDIVHKLKLLGESKNALFMLDRVLGERKAERE
jgi:ferritin